MDISPNRQQRGTLGHFFGSGSLGWRSNNGCAGLKQRSTRSCPNTKVSFNAIPPIYVTFRGDVLSTF